MFIYFLFLRRPLLNIPYIYIYRYLPNTVIHPYSFTCSLYKYKLRRDKHTYQGLRLYTFVCVRVCMPVVYV